MKLSKNVLVGSLASAGMVLGLVAPATTAFAATTSGAYDESTGTVSHVDPKTEVGSLNESSTIAIALDSTEGAEDGQATAKSNVNVKVLSGILVLDAVPDFGFGNVMAGKTVDLKDNTAEDKVTGAEDGNANGELSVIDSRSEAGGFTLSAALGEFSDADGNVPTKAFDLTLNPVELSGGAGNTNVSKFESESATLESALKGAASSQQTVISAAPTDYTAGSKITGLFNTSTSASLKTPAEAAGTDADGKTTNSVKAYKAAITWTLQTKAPTAG